MYELVLPNSYICLHILCIQSFFTGENENGRPIKPTIPKCFMNIEFYQINQLPTCMLLQSLIMNHKNLTALR